MARAYLPSRVPTAADQAAGQSSRSTATGHSLTIRSVRPSPFLPNCLRQAHVIVYALAQASKAIIPKDAGGPWGRRIGVSVQGSLNWALRVGAYSTKRLSSSDWNRYALVVMNCMPLIFPLYSLIFLPGNDNAAASWNPQPVTATIEFRGQQATYTFPVGVVRIHVSVLHPGN
jgi:hypothetical protein